jgi:uncharacterized protein (UPF0264 family)
MQLLVSVSDAFEATEALAGGAHIVDAKDPSRGALGAVSLEVFDDIVAAVGRTVTISAALGDMDEAEDTARAAHEFAARGASFVKVGFANIVDPVRATRLLARVVHEVTRGGSDCGVVAVAYADASRVNAITPLEVLGVAGDAGARGVLVDTANKSGPGLAGCWSQAEISDWVEAVRRSGLVASVAGKLGLTDMAFVAQAVPDVIGVRGSACIGGRDGRVAAERVRELRQALAREADGLLLRSE